MNATSRREQQMQSFVVHQAPRRAIVSMVFLMSSPAVTAVAAALLNATHRNEKNWKRRPLLEKLNPAVKTLVNHNSESQLSSLGRKRDPSFQYQKKRKALKARQKKSFQENANSVWRHFGKINHSQRKMMLSLARLRKKSSGFLLTLMPFASGENAGALLRDLVHATKKEPFDAATARLFRESNAFSVVLSLCNRETAEKLPIW